jgi:uncharacterized membrane-anchored protein
MRILGTARVDRRTKNLIHRIRPGEIAVISHSDIDAPCASALAGRKVAAVVNAQRSLSGRFPHPGPGVLLQAGVPVIDDVGDPALERLRDGDEVEIIDGALYTGGNLLAAGSILSDSILEQQLEEAKRNVTAQLADFVENTLSYVSREQSLLFSPADLPEIRTRIKGRHCLIVVRGTGAAGDLRAIRSYINAARPAIMGVDGGADLLLQEGYRPHVRAPVRGRVDRTRLPEREGPGPGASPVPRSPGHRALLPRHQRRCRYAPGL